MVVRGVQNQETSPLLRMIKIAGISPQCVIMDAPSLLASRHTVGSQVSFLNPKNMFLEVNLCVCVCVSLCEHHNSKTKSRMFKFGMLNVYHRGCNPKLFIGIGSLEKGVGR